MKRITLLGATGSIGLRTLDLVSSFSDEFEVAGLAAAIDILGVFRYMRADWDPAYGLKAVPLVFLARLDVAVLIPLALGFGVLAIGGENATRRADLPNDFLLVFVGLLLLSMILTQYLAARRARGRPTLPGVDAAGPAAVA